MRCRALAGKKEQLRGTTASVLQKEPVRAQPCSAAIERAAAALEHHCAYHLGGSSAATLCVAQLLSALFDSRVGSFSNRLIAFADNPAVHGGASTVPGLIGDAAAKAAKWVAAGVPVPRVVET